MSTIVAIAGSLREASYNAALVRAAKELAPKGMNIEIASIRGIPLYNADVEAVAIPDAVAELKDQVARADGLLLASPEYNQSIPGVMKNVIDWLSRPATDLGRVFGGHVVGLIGATPGRGGTRFAQNAWLQVFRSLSVRPFFGSELYIDAANTKFDSSGALIDVKTKELLAKYLEKLGVFIAGPVSS